MPTHLILLAILAFTVFQPDETVRRYGGASPTWHLETLNDAAFEAEATLTFPSRNIVAGSGPCNAFRSTNTTPYPWIELGPIAATRRACPALDAEAAYFEALKAARVVVIEGKTLTLSDEEKPLAMFKARD